MRQRAADRHHADDLETRRQASQQVRGDDRTEAVTDDDQTSRLRQPSEDAMQHPGSDTKLRKVVVGLHEVRSCQGYALDGMGAWPSCATIMPTQRYLHSAHPPLKRPAVPASRFTDWRLDGPLGERLVIIRDHQGMRVPRRDHRHAIQGRVPECCQRRPQSLPPLITPMTMSHAVEKEQDRLGGHRGLSGHDWNSKSSAMPASMPEIIPV